MLSWIKKILGLGADKSKGSVKNFDRETKDIDIQDYKRTGERSVQTDKIIGSVGRSHELDENFRYRKRAVTERYHSISDAINEGKPLDPVKLLRVKRERGNSEYYVLDGHHRVAEAKKRRFDEMNADVTDVVFNENSDKKAKDITEGDDSTDEG